MATHSIWGEDYLAMYKTNGTRDEYYRRRFGHTYPMPSNHHPVEVKVDSAGRDYVVVSDQSLEGKMRVEDVVAALKKRRM